MYEYMLDKHIIERFFPPYFIVDGKRYDVTIKPHSQEVDHDVYAVRIDNHHNINVGFKLELPKHITGTRSCYKGVNTKNYLYQACLPPVFQTSKMLPGLSVVPWEGAEPIVAVDGSTTRKLFTEKCFRKSLTDIRLEVPIPEYWYEPFFGSKKEGMTWYLNQEEWMHLFDLAQQNVLPRYSDVSNWFVLDGREIVTLIIARKIKDTIRRLRRPGALPGSNIKFALVDLFSSHMYQSVYTGADIHTEDKIITPYFRWNTPATSEAYVKNNPYICLAATKQDTDAGKIAMINCGVSIENNEFILDEENYRPVPKLLCNNPFILRTEPHRYPIARTLYTQALPIVGESDPFIRVENLDPVPATNLLTARMVWDVKTTTGIQVSTTEDGAIVSETAAKKLGCFKEYKVTKEMSLYDKIVDVNPQLLFAEKIQTRYDSVEDFDPDETKKILPGDDLYTVKKSSGETYTVKAKISAPGTITYCKTHKTTRNGMPTKTAVIVMTVFFPLEIGDKISDLHTNKCTIGAIIPDSEMPTIDEKPIELIMEPWMGSRCNPSADMEAAMSIWCYENSSEEEEMLLDIDPYIDGIVPGLKDVEEITGSITYHVRTLMYKDKPVHNVSIGQMRIMRIDQIASEKYRASDHLILNECGLTRNGVGNLRVPEFAIFARSIGANKMFEEIVESAKSSKTPQIVSSFMDIMGLYHDNGKILQKEAFITENEAKNKEYLQLKKTLDRKKYLNGEVDIDLLQRLMNGGEIDIVETVLDERLDNTYGYVILPEGVEDIFGRKTSSDRNCVVLPNGYTFTVETADGEKVVGPVQKAFNRVIAETNFYNSVKDDKDLMKVRKHFAKVKWSVKNYFHVLAGVLVGKNGLIRELLLPREEGTSWLTLQGHIDAIDDIYVPRRILNKMLDNKRIADTYGAEKAEDFIGKYIMVTRTPPHKYSHVIALRINIDDTLQYAARVHDCITSSFLLGDKDGDMLFLRFARSEETLKDYEMFNIWQHESSFKGSKYLEDVKMSESSVWNHVRKARGMSSSIENIEKEGKVSNNWDYITYSNRMDLDEIDAMQRTAATDYYIVKMGTAESGSIGNMLRILMPAILGERAMKSANEIYHVTAQNALDSKKGSDMMFSKLVSALVSNVIPGAKVCQYLEELNASEETIADVYELIETLSRNRMSVREAAKSIAPVMMTTQTIAKLDPVSAIVSLKDWNISNIERAYSMCM